MSRPPLRPAQLALVIALAFAVAPLHAQDTAVAPPSAPTQFNIAAKPLGQALGDWALQTRVQLIVQPALVSGKMAPTVSGSLTPQQALDRLLAGSGLVAVPEGSAIVVKAASAVGSERTLAPVTVTANAEPETATGPVQGYIAKRSATATKTDTPLNEVPQSVSVITTDQMVDQGSMRVSQAMRYTAGVRAEQYGPGNRGDVFLLRGGSSGSTLLDGLRLPQGQNYGYTRNVPYNFERIEVLRGPSSLIAGQSGPGGVVNLVSKRPLAETHREVGIQLGDHNHKQIQADFTGPLDAEGKLLYRLVAVGMDSGTEVRHADEKRVLLAPSLTWKPLAGTTLTVFAEYQKDKTGNIEQYFADVGTLKPAPHGRLPTKTFIGEPDWDRFDGTRKRVGWELEQQLSDQWALRHRLRYDDNGPGEYYSMYARWFEGFVDAGGNPNPYGTSMNRSWFAKKETRRDTAADLLLEGKVSTGPVQHRLLFGIDGLWSRSADSSDGGPATPLDLYNPLYGTFAEPTITDPEVRNRMRNVGFVIQDQIKFNEQWVLLAGLRRDRAVTSADTEQQTDKATSRNLGLVWLAGNGWSPYASYLESFEPVFGSKTDGSLFRPKYGKQTELGVKWQSADQRISASAAVYRLRENNRVVADPMIVGEQTQLGEVSVKGAELEFAAHLAKWDLMAQYTHINAKNTGTTKPGEQGQQLLGQPKHTAALWAVHKLGYLGLPGLRVGMGVRYAGSTGTGLEGGVRVPSVALLDAMIGYDIGNWRWAVNASNLTDKVYVNSCQEARGARCWYGSRRKVIASATYRW